MRVAVAFDHLRRNGRNGEAETLADFLFDLRAKMSAGAYGAGDLSDGDVFCGGFEAREVAAIFVIPVGDFQTEGDGLGVDAMSAADLRRVFELPGAALENFTKAREAGCDQLGGFTKEQGLSGIHNVVGSEAVMQPAGGFGIVDGFADSDGEGNDVMADFRFDFVDARDVNAGAFAQAQRSFARDNTRFGENVGGGEFDVEPFLEFVFVGPELAHLRARVSWYHTFLQAEPAKKVKSSG